MPRIPRKLLVDPTEVGVFHCVSRCVRRAVLCGADPLTGRNFDHRKRWLQEWIAFLAGRFEIDVLGFIGGLHIGWKNQGSRKDAEQKTRFAFLPCCTSQLPQGMDCPGGSQTHRAGCLAARARFPDLPA